MKSRLAVLSSIIILFATSPSMGAGVLNGPWSADFGVFRTGTTETQEIIVTNIGDAQIFSLRYLEVNSPNQGPVQFSLIAPGSEILDPGASTSVAYQGVAPNNRTASSSSGMSTITGGTFVGGGLTESLGELVSLSAGAIVSPIVTWDLVGGELIENTIDFGQVNVGQTVVAQVELFNSTTDSLLFNTSPEDVRLSIGNTSFLDGSGVFATDFTGGILEAPGISTLNSVIFSIAFQPTSVGQFFDTFSFMTDDSNPLGILGNVQTISLTGIATVPIPPALYLFGSGLIGLIGMARRKAA